MTTTTEKEGERQGATSEQRTGNRRKKEALQRVSHSGPTGPKTLRGKMKSRYNAIKHGIFASVVLRGNVLKESRADYLNLLESFRESLQPEGGLEEFLVEKLAQIAWRKARVVRAEAAMVMKQTEYLRQKREGNLRDAVRRALPFARHATGLASVRDNFYALSKSVYLLELLRDAVAERGFEPNVDEGLLGILYGDSGKTEAFYSLYLSCADEAKELAKQSPAEKSKFETCKQRFLRGADMELTRLKGEMADCEAREEVELPLEEESLAIPKEEELDRLLRYETRLDGTFDRTLTQLERQQRMRLGQPNLPPVKVELS